jgi:hypothetical protein
MAKPKKTDLAWHPDKEPKGTSIGRGHFKIKTMNKNKKASYKPYRGQGK